MSHLYPKEFAEHIFNLLTDPQSHCRHGSGLDFPSLENLLSVCYQASFLREEERPARFRLILSGPESFSSCDAPPEGIQRFEFADRRPGSEDELRRLFPAVSFHRSMIGVSFDSEQSPSIWGIVHTGSRWLQLIHGGTQKINPIPDALIIFVTGPGRITVSVGLSMIAGLRGGKLISSARDILSSDWLRVFISMNQSRLWVLHRENRGDSSADWPEIAPEFPLILAQNLMRRVISLIRNYRHGGMLVILQTESGEEFKELNPYMNIKYIFTQDQERPGVQRQIARVMAELAGSRAGAPGPVGWSDYQAASTASHSSLDEMLFEKANLLAELTLVDGAVVLNSLFELVGFGAEIYCGLDNVTTVWKAVDIEGEVCEPESVRGVGTRHRSAYRLCRALQGALAIVVSQDGQVRFVRWHNGNVTCWDQTASSILDF